MRLWICIAFVVCLLAPPASHAQSSVGEIIQQVGEEYASAYVQPVVDAAGTGLNSGFFHTARVGTGPLSSIDLYVGVKSAVAFVPADDLTMNLSFEERRQVRVEGEVYDALVSYEVRDAPTALGSGEAGQINARAVYENADGETQTIERTIPQLPGALATDLFPTVVPQVGVGLPLIGTQVSVRYLPRVSYRDVGSLQIGGIGVRHDVSSYVSVLPFALATHGFYQVVSIADNLGNEFVNGSTLAFGLSASKRVLVTTFYAGLQYEQALAELNYTFDPGEDLPVQTISTDLTGENTFRALAGLTFNIGPVALSIDYGQGQQSALSAGLGVSL